MGLLITRGAAVGAAACVENPEKDRQISAARKSCKGKGSCTSVLSKSKCDVYWAISRITPARKLECRIVFFRKDLAKEPTITRLANSSQHG